MLFKKYLISQKSGIAYLFPHFFAKIKVDPNYSLPIEEILILNNVIIHIKSIPNKDKNHYYCKIYLEKFLHQLAKRLSQNFFLYYNNGEIWKEK